MRERERGRERERERERERDCSVKNLIKVMVIFWYFCNTDGILP